MVGKRQRRSLKSQQFHPVKCGSMAFQIISSLLALRGLYAILASDEISYLNYSPSNIQSSQGNNNNNNNNHLQQLKKVFHPIHVYRGSETAIQNLDTKTTEMRQYYNPKSQVDQDKIVSALTKQLDAKISLIRKKLFFVDLAANDAIQLSNTLQLEEEGWHGLCIEPNPIYWYRLAHRKCDIAAAFVGGKEDMQQVDVSLTNEEYGGIVGDKMDNRQRARQKTEKRYTISLQSLFQEFQVPSTIDYMSLDVEGAEELVMEHFPFQLYTIRFMTLERPKPALQKILKSNGYQFVMMLVYWGETLWVHESVLKSLTLQEIEQTVRANSKYVERTPKNRQEVFNIETGEYRKG